MLMFGGVVVADEHADSGRPCAAAAAPVAHRHRRQGVVGGLARWCSCCGCMGVVRSDERSARRRPKRRRPGAQAAPRSLFSLYWSDHAGTSLLLPGAALLLLVLLVVVGEAVVGVDANAQADLGTKPPTAEAFNRGREQLLLRLLRLLASLQRRRHEILLLLLLLLRLLLLLLLQLLLLGALRALLAAHARLVAGAVAPESGCGWPCATSRRHLP